MGAADLISNGKQVAIIDYHDGDSFSNSYGNARLTYYNPSGTPTAYFDGGNAVVGGNHTTSMYSYYLPKYNARIAIPSAFNIHINGSESGYNYSITAVVDNLSGGTISNTYFQFALTQSNIVYSWQGMSEINHALRIMAPNQNGTLLTVMSGNSQTINLNFTRNSAWPEADCEIVAFIQNNTSKEVLQAIKLPLNELLPLAADAGLIGVSNLPVGACSGIANPIVQLKNFSSTNVNSAVIKYSINGGILANYNWSGNLTQNQVQNVSLPQMSYTVGPNNNFIAYLYSTNGVADLNPVNDTTEGSFNEALTYGFNVNLELLTDNNPSQTTWQVKNAAGTIITQGGPYNQPNTLIQQVINVNETGCYRFIINDSGNDGICCSSGNGYYRLTDYYGEVIQLGGDFDNIETTEFNLTGFQVNAMVFLEGPFDEWSLDMNTSLNQEGFIPLMQPFSGSPWNYTGTETVTFIPNSSVVDWILVECRETAGDASTATEQTVVGRRAAFIHKFGYIVDLDGVSPVRFNIEINENLYLVLWHRNHLGIMSSAPLTSSGGTYYYDFTSDQFQTYGGAAGCVDIKNLGLWGMAAGDMNGDGQINADDKNYIWIPQAGTSEYLSGDINLNGQTDNIDKNDVLPGNLGMSTQVP